MKVYTLLMAFLFNCYEPIKNIENSLKTNISDQITKEDTVMIDKENVKAEYYDFQTTQNGTRSVSYERGDGWLIELWAMNGMSYGVSTEYAPTIDFYEIQKSYYLNGVIKERVKLMSGVAFGKRECFDEKGNCIKIVDEDKKFGNIKKEDILDLLEKEGWFNRRTGRNVITEDTILSTDYSFYREITKYMRITFKRAVKDNDENEFEPPKWYVYMHPGKGDYTIQYIVDGNTGTYEKEKTFVQLIE